jgi:hypothetical protein
MGASQGAAALAETGVKMTTVSSNAEAVSSQLNVMDASILI